MKSSLGPSPGSARHPEHRLIIREAEHRYIVEIDSLRVADSSNALLLDESGYDPVVYFPPNDVKTSLLGQSDSKTTCPFKGQASYFAANIGGESKDVAWVYPSVYDDVASIKGFVAFYSDRVALTELPKTTNA